jgi:methionine synthase I (cobalamin-dependent)
VKSKRIDLINLNNSLNRPFILDGAIGCQLISRNITADKDLWSSIANISHPDEVMRLHKEYISSGADIITTNTFRTNPMAIKRSNYELSVEKFVSAGIEIAINAADDKNIIIAGSNAPAEDCYQSERTLSKYELEYNHKKHIELLWENGCDIIWNETLSHMDEIELIGNFCSSNKLPFVMNLFFTDQLKLLSGNSLIDVVKTIADFSPIAIGFNCIKAKLFFEFIHDRTLPEQWGCYFNCGKGNVFDEPLECEIDPSQYVKIIEPLFELKPFYIGSCCGSSPYHTKAIKEAVDEIYRD